MVLKKIDCKAVPIKLPTATNLTLKDERILQTLLACLGRNESSSTTLTALTISEQENLLSLAESHHILPLLDSRLLMSGLRDKLPAHLAANLKTAALETKAINLGRLVQLETILKAFAAVKIDAILLKGLQLALFIYDQPTERTMGDFDLLLHPDDLPAAQRVMSSLQYQPSRSYDIDFTMQMNKHMPPYKRPNWPTVELHWNLEDPQNPLNLDMTGIWERSEHLEKAGASARVLSIPDLIQHLSIHAVNHHHLHTGLRPLVDLQAVLEKHGDMLDWEALASIAHAAHTTRPTSLMLRLVRDLLGTPVPEQAFALLQTSPMDQGLYQAAQQMVCIVPEYTPEVTPDLAKLFNHPNLFQKIHIILRRIFLSPRVMATIYPVRPDSPMILLYYAQRFFYLLKTYSRVLYVRLRRSPEVIVQVEQQSFRSEMEKELSQWLQD